MLLIGEDHFGKRLQFWLPSHGKRRLSFSQMIGVEISIRLQKDLRFVFAGRQGILNAPRRNRFRSRTGSSFFRWDKSTILQKMSNKEATTAPIIQFFHPPPFSLQTFHPSWRVRTSACPPYSKYSCKERKWQYGVLIWRLFGS